MEHNYDFSGWATKNDLKCSDGRTIRHNAFKDCDGIEVPLVWNHSHGEPENVLGHAMLKNMDEGVYCYGTFNDTSSGQVAKVLVQHGDIKALSIYANKLKQIATDVVHGVIREVSLVHAGANPGAYIDTVIAHADDNDEEAIIYTGESLALFHADEKPEAKKDGEKSDEKKSDDKTVEEIINGMSEEEQNVLYALLGQALGESGEDDSKKENKDSKEDKEMKHNVFDNDNKDDSLMHDGLNTILKDAKRYGSLKESFLAHATEYGIENIEYLQPEAQNIYDKPQFIANQPSDWVSKVINGVHNTPFAKVQMMFADVTEDEARAKGYIKGKLKKEEVFKLLKRSVTPTTIYKKQKFDRDDLLDAEFDIVPWIRQEMELKLEEEKARAYIFGDGRSSSDDDKINETNIIPVISDSDLFTIKVEVTPESGESLEHAIITNAVLAQDDYQGSGNTTAFIETKQVSKMLLMEDQFGHRLYKDMKELASAMGVGEVVKVPSGVCPADFYGVILDIRDYNVGMKNAGKKTMFDDFDIDYNQQKYLLETRQSGALTRPYSAIVLKKAQAAG
jgi:hypothetical protein